MYEMQAGEEYEAAKPYDTHFGKGVKGDPWKRPEQPAVIDEPVYDGQWFRDLYGEDQ